MLSADPTESRFFVQIKASLLACPENTNLLAKLWMTMFRALNVCGGLKFPANDICTCRLRGAYNKPHLIAQLLKFLYNAVSFVI